MVKLRKEKQKKFIGSALIMLVVFIFSGLYLVEMQINDLTRESEFAKILNIKRDQQTKEVMLYFMGMGNDLGEWAYLKYDANGEELVLSVAENRKLRIPYRQWYTFAADNFSQAKMAAEKYYEEVFY